MSKLSEFFAPKYLSLTKYTYLKLLEEPLVFKTTTDDLYKLNQSAFQFLKKCDGTSTVEELQPETDFLRFCLEEELLELLEEPQEKEIEVNQADTPSLRYLLVNITGRCNLKCKHCYLGKANATDLSLFLIQKVLKEFEEMGGLRLIVSGGEPLLHPHFSKINELVKNRAFRSILITNATLLDKASVPVNELNFTEVQVSLDGLEKGHDFLRGKGTFKKTLTGINILKEAEIDLSIATMIHAFNLEEFPQLEKLVRSLGAISWVIDVPTPTGRLKDHLEIMPNLEVAGKLLQYQYGAEIHNSQGDYACGAHLACLHQDGLLSKCGFYREEWGRYIQENLPEGLRKSWQQLPKMRFSDLDSDCLHCKYLEDCRGGCRYRAEVYQRRTGPDPVKCSALYHTVQDSALGVKTFKK